MLTTGDVTLQVNLSPGDLAYAASTVPRLVAAHPGVAERLAIVDCCRPQRTRILDPDKRMPAAAFAERSTAIRRLAEEFRAGGLFDKVVCLEPGDARFARLARRYVRPWMTESHDFGGCAFMAYWAALDLPGSRFVLHYDADILLHQREGFDWALEAIRRLVSLPQAVAAAPRTSPPGFAKDEASDAPSAHEGRPRERVAGGWLNDWFSTRCLLVDRERLAPRLPLLRRRHAPEMLLRRWLSRGYPPVPEQVLFHQLGTAGCRCLQLGSAEAWFLHPGRKDAEFLRLLPRMLDSVARGAVPPDQKGQADIRLESWPAFLGVPSGS